MENALSAAPILLMLVMAQRRAKAAPFTPARKSACGTCVDLSSGSRSAQTTS